GALFRIEARRSASAHRRAAIYTLGAYEGSGVPGEIPMTKVERDKLRHQARELEGRHVMRKQIALQLGVSQRYITFLLGSTRAMHRTCQGCGTSHYCIPAKKRVS